MTTVEEADAWIGRVVVDRTGRRVGRITRVWIDDYSGLPAWATLRTRWPGRREGIAPLSPATAEGWHKELACRKAEVASAPQVSADGHLGLDDEWRLCNHYNIAGPPDPTRQDAECTLSGSAMGTTTSTGSHHGELPADPGARGRRTPAHQHPRASHAEPSGRLSLGLRRRLGLG